MDTRYLQRDYSSTAHRSISPLSKSHRGTKSTFATNNFVSSNSKGTLSNKLNQNETKYPIPSMPREPYRKYLYGNVEKSSSRISFLTVTPERTVERPVSERPRANRTSVLPKIGPAGSQRARGPALHPAARNASARTCTSKPAAFDRATVRFYFLFPPVPLLLLAAERERERQSWPSFPFSLSLIDSSHRGPSLF